MSTRRLRPAGFFFSSSLHHFHHLSVSFPSPSLAACLHSFLSKILRISLSEMHCCPASNRCVCERAHVRVCLLVLLHTETQNTHFTTNVGTFLGSEDILVGPHNFKSLFDK